MLLRRGGLVAARGGTPSDTLPADIIHDAPLALRLANPAEAALANDRGACVHVRLRLGVHHRGSGGVGAFSFFSPPSVYYRVYTHHPVADLNALSPGAYFEDAKRRAEAYARSKNPSRSRAACGEASPLASAMTDANATYRYVRIEHNDWRPLPARAARALAEDERTLAEAALASLGGFFDATKERPSTTVSASSSSSRLLSSGARRRRRRSTSASEASSARSSARVTNRGARSDAAATRATLRRRTRAWSAGGDESGGGTTEYDECVDSDDTDDELDSLLEWSAGLDFEAFDVSWREAFHGEAREAPRVE